jgi:hypothetical protein
MGRVAETGDGSTLSLDFTTMSGTLDSRITFSRADATARATFINSLGYVETVPAGQPQAPRFDFVGGVAKGLLLEAPTTNLCRQGQYCWGGDWGIGNAISINSVPQSSGPNPVARIDGPDGGSLTGTSIFKASNITFQRLATAETVSALQQYTYSMWVRAGTGGATYFRLAPFNGGSALTTVGSCNDPAVTINNASGFGSQFSNIPTDRWVRVSVVFTTVSGQSSVLLTVYPNLDTSAASTNYIWGAQLETGSVASSTILTGASTVTRAVDTAIIAAGTNFSSWYTGGTTGTFVSNWYGSASSTTARSVIATSDVDDQHLHLYQTPSALTLRLADYLAVATVTTANSLTANALTKGAFSYASTATSLCLNGGTVATNTLGFSVAPTFLSIGGPSINGTSITDTSVMLNNSIRTLKYFPTRLSDAQIQTLTTP